MALSSLLAVVCVGRTRSGGTLGEMDQLADLLLKRHLAQELGDPLLDCRIVELWRGRLRSK